MESMNALGFEACRLAYTLGKGWMEEMLQVIWDNFKFASAYLKERLPMIKPIELQGTYLMWLDCTALGKNSKGAGGADGSEAPSCFWTKVIFSGRAASALNA